VRVGFKVKNAIAIFLPFLAAATPHLILIPTFRSPFLYAIAM